MNGNRVYLYYRNTTELSDWPKPNVSKWPNNPEGTKMLDGIGLLVGARVYIEDDFDPNTVDTIPITDLNELANSFSNFQPTKTVHLAAISSAVEANKYPNFSYDIQINSLRNLLSLKFLILLLESFETNKQNLKLFHQ